MMLITYILYLHASAWLTFWVGHSLHKNGRYFLVEAFADERIADAINKLLLVGFYLVNFAYVLFVLKEKQDIVGMAGVIEVLSTKVGLIAFTLAVMHFFNLFLFATFRQYRMGALKHKLLNTIFEKLSSKGII